MGVARMAPEQSCNNWRIAIVASFPWTTSDASRHGGQRAVRTYGEGAKFLIRVDAHADYPTAIASSC